MKPRFSLVAVFVIGFATAAGAQLASQTALVGTVTDAGGGCSPARW